MASKSSGSFRCSPPLPHPPVSAGHAPPPHRRPRGQHRWVALGQQHQETPRTSTLPPSIPSQKAPLFIVSISSCSPLGIGKHSMQLHLIFKNPVSRTRNAPEGSQSLQDSHRSRADKGGGPGPSRAPYMASNAATVPSPLLHVFNAGLLSKRHSEHHLTNHSCTSHTGCRPLPSTLRITLTNRTLHFPQLKDLNHRIHAELLARPGTSRLFQMRNLQEGSTP